MVKKLLADAEIRNTGLIPGSGRPLEEGMATHSSILAWRIPWTEEPGRLQSIGELDTTKATQHIYTSSSKNHCSVTSMVVQWLRLHAPNAGGLG